MNSIGRRLALTQSWWMWPDREIRGAVERVHLRTWLPLVRAALEANRRAGRDPATFNDLNRPLDRNPRNIERLMSGEHGLTSQLAIGLSVTLGIPIKEFFPETEVWLTLTGLFLCGRSVAAEEMQAYVAYRRHGPAFSNPHLDLCVVERIARELPGTFASQASVEQAILKSADTLGGILERLSGGKAR